MVQQQSLCACSCALVLSTHVISHTFLVSHHVLYPISDCHQLYGWQLLFGCTQKKRVCIYMLQQLHLLAADSVAARLYLSTGHSSDGPISHDVVGFQGLALPCVVFVFDSQALARFIHRLKAYI